MLAVVVLDESALVIVVSDIKAHVFKCFKKYHMLINTKAACTVLCSGFQFITFNKVTS